MATVDELLNSVQDETYTRLTKYVLSPDYEDDVGPVEVNGRTIGDISSEISIEGEDSSQYITFIIPRYYDGIDLTTMNINVHYETVDGQASNDFPVNAYYSDEHIKFGWIIPQQAVAMAGTISICIFAVGIHNYKNYIFKTETKKYTVKSGLDINGGIIEPDENWYLNFIERLEGVTEDLIKELQEEADKTIAYFEENYKRITDIDDSISSTSVRPVQNKVISAALNNKQNKATVQDGYLIF